MFLQGLAVPQGVIGWFGRFLAERGWGVLSFDYRGVGKSCNEGSEEHITLDDWVNLDLPAAAAAVRRRCNPRFLAVFAHSLGGQLLGQSPIGTQIDGALLLAAQCGIPRLFHGRGWLSVRYAYTLFPLLIHLIGRLPVSRFTFPQRCPAGAILQWVKWGRTGTFTDIEDRNLEAHFAHVRIPLTAITIADDPYAPPAAVDVLTRMYVNASIQRRTLHPSTYGVDRIGHFGFFDRRMPEKLWMAAEEMLRELERVHMETCMNDFKPHHQKS
jgi:predicted alpha/beta hydrolase